MKVANHTGESPTMETLENKEYKNTPVTVVVRLYGREINRGEKEKDARASC